MRIWPAGSIPWFKEKIFGIELPKDRLYEWRLASGKRSGDPEYAPNACIFYLRSMKSGKAAEAVSTNISHTNIWVHVSLTGEKVSINTDNRGAYLHNTEDAQRFKI